MRHVAAGLFALLLVATVGAAVHGFLSPLGCQVTVCTFEDPPSFSVYLEADLTFLADPDAGRHRASRLGDAPLVWVLEDRAARCGPGMRLGDRNARRPFDAAPEERR